MKSYIYHFLLKGFFQGKYGDSRSHGVFFLFSVILLTELADNWPEAYEIVSSQANLDNILLWVSPYLLSLSTLDQCRPHAFHWF